MITRDFHGVPEQTAILCVHDMVGRCRQERKTIDVEFIVGHGVIKPAVMKLLSDYGLNPSIKIGNSGVIKCIIE